MVSVVDLWIPILLSAVFVFFASSLLHMVLPLHRSDYAKLPAEDSLRDAMRSSGLPPGHYYFPHCTDMKEMGSPEMMAKLKQGPVGFLTVVPSGAPAMGKLLLQWFLYSVFLSLLTGYVASIALPRGAEGMQVFRMTGTVAMAAYGLSYVPNSIWKGLSWSISLKFVFDGLIYGLLTAAAFLWWWPAA